MPHQQEGEEAVGFAAVAGEWRAHWRTGVATMIGIGLCTSVSAVVFSMFIMPLEAEFGWSRGEISSAKSMTILSALLAPFVGRLLDLHGVRNLMLAGMAGMGIGYALFAKMTGALWQYYALMAFIMVIGIPTSGLAFGRVISAVFVRSRGFSLAAGRSGMAISTMLLPPFLFFVTSQYGWRNAFLAMAGLVLLVALPTAWAFIERGSAAPRAVARARPLPVRELLSNWRVVVVSLAAMFAYMPVFAIISQLQPLVAEAGIEPSVASRLIGLIGVSTFVGALCAGMLIDRFWAPLIGFLMLLLAAIGALLLVFGQGNVAMIVAGIILVGLGQGAEHDLVAFTVARYFGVANFSGIYGVTVMTLSIGIAIAVSAIGVLHDYTGTYEHALYIASALFVVSGLLYLSLGPYPDRTAGGETGAQAA